MPVSLSYSTSASAGASPLERSRSFSITSSTETRNGASRIGQSFAITAAPPRDDASAVELSSPADKLAAYARSRALIEISDAQSYIDIASGAANEIEGLVDRAKEIAKQLRDGVSNPETRSALSEEGATIVAEISAVATQATLNDHSVISAGPRVFGADLNAGDFSSRSNFSLTVGSVPLSVTDLGLSGIDADSFLTSPDTVHSSFSQAQNTVFLSQESLASSSTALSQFASSFGLSGRASSDSETSEPEELSELISASLSSDLLQAHNPTASHLQSILDSSRDPSVKS